MSQSTEGHSRVGALVVLLACANGELGIGAHVVIVEHLQFRE